MSLTTRRTVKAIDARRGRQDWQVHMFHHMIDCATIAVNAASLLPFTMLLALLPATAHLTVLYASCCTWTELILHAGCIASHH